MVDISDTDAPQTCPECGREAIAIILDGDSQTATTYADDACEVERSELPRSVGWVDVATYVHVA
jgi:hypothetical protein